MPDINQAIYQMQRADEETAARDRANQAKLPYVSLIGYSILANTLHLVTPQEAVQYGVMPFLRVGSKLRVAVLAPRGATLAFLQHLADRTSLEITLSLCSETSFTYALNLYVTAEKKVREQQVAVTKESQRHALQSINSRAELESKLARASATEVLDILFAGATGMEASDIHIEPQEKNVRVRYRIDGVLQEIALLPTPIYRQVLSRVKFLAHMKLDVKNVNQDGRFTIELAGTTLDVRTSTLPSAYGEIIDMRLLRAHTELIKLDDLGLTPAILAMIKEAIALPHGMVLVTGPTGSGKTTTLYAILDSLNQSGVKIITLEDPIEYRIDGIDQVQIQEDQGLTFAEALKGVLRQDPDIILVGEIRDKDTADIGLQAAMTGHLFLSTLHTNSAPASLSRLIDMGIEPYKIAGAINLIIAQRLVRKRCTECNGAGCEACHKTGFKGRIPIIEALKPSKMLDDAILAKKSVRDLYDLAIQQGMVPMYEDGLAKVAQGLTTKEEVERVTAELSND